MNEYMNFRFYRLTEEDFTEDLDASFESNDGTPLPLNKTAKEATFCNMDESRLSFAPVSNSQPEMNKTAIDASFCNMDVSSLNKTYAPASSSQSEMNKTAVDTSFCNKSFVPETNSQPEMNKTEDKVFLETSVSEQYESRFR
jgi:hypothetical protein